MKVFNVTLVNENAPEPASYERKYKTVYVRAYTFAEAEQKALGVFPDMTVASMDMVSSTFIE